jgi:hypothetical protein
MIVFLALPAKRLIAVVDRGCSTLKNLFRDGDGVSRFHTRHLD